MTPRQAYVAKRLGIVALIGLALFGWIHGIYWAGGVSGMKAWAAGKAAMPWEAALIDGAPVWLAVGGVPVFFGVLVLLNIADSAVRAYQRLPTKAEVAASRQAELEANIARLEWELGLLPSEEQG